MATPVTSSNWVITFQRASLVDQRTFSITLGPDVPKAVVLNLVSELKQLDYENVRALLMVVLP